MGCKIYVGNLPWKCASDDLAKMLQEMGYDFVSAKVVTDRESGQSRGFAFVELKTPQAAQEAVANLNGHLVDGRPLRVDLANEKPRGSGRGGHRGSGNDRRGGRDQEPLSFDTFDSEGDRW